VCGRILLINNRSDGSVVLCIFGRPLRVGAVGLRFIYFHLSSLRMVWLQKLTIFLIAFWKVLVGSLDMGEKCCCG